MEFRIEALRLASLAQGIRLVEWLAMSEPSACPRRAEGESNGGGGSRSARILKFSNNLEKPKRSIGEIREKAGVQVHNRYSESRPSFSFLGEGKTSEPEQVDQSEPRKLESAVHHRPRLKCGAADCGPFCCKSLLGFSTRAADSPA